MGTMMPSAPTSSERAMKWYSSAGTRTNGARSAAREEAISMRMVSMLQPVCSMSKIRKSAPAAAAIRGSPVVLNSKTMLPSGTPPSRRIRLARFSLMTAISLALLFPRTAGKPLELLRQERARQDLPVDDRPGDPALRDLQDAPARAQTVLLEAFVGPADRMRREDDVLEI